MKNLIRMSSVSGGSITAGVLGLGWKSLQFNAQNVATNLDEILIKPVRKPADVTIDKGSIIKGIILLWKTIAEEVADAYREYLFGKATLEALPLDNEGPRFVINATNVQTKVLWRFSRPALARLTS